ncbi:MAG: SPW repeat protein, partial [Ferrovibrio sp.]
PERHPPGSQRRWQDWANMALGLLLAASPWLLRFTGLEAATLNAVIIGGLVFALSALALTLLDRWEAYISGMLGIWAILSPWLIGFTAYGMAVAAHVALGALVVVIAAIEIWQDGRS